MSFCNVLNQGDSSCFSDKINYFVAALKDVPPKTEEPHHMYLADGTNFVFNAMELKC